MFSKGNKSNSDMFDSLCNFGKPVNLAPLRGILLFYYKGCSERMVFFRNKTNGPPPLGTFWNKNVTFGQKKSGFRGQKNGHKNFTKRFRNTGPAPLFWEIFLKIPFFTASLISFKAFSLHHYDTTK